MTSVLTVARGRAVYGTPHTDVYVAPAAAWYSSSDTCLWNTNLHWSHKSRSPTMLFKLLEKLIILIVIFMSVTLEWMSKHVSISLNIIHSTRIYQYLNDIIYWHHMCKFIWCVALRHYRYIVAFKTFPSKIYFIYRFCAQRSQ